MTDNVFLLLAGSASGLAALAHLGCIYFGAPWYQFFGAGDKMVQWAQQKSLKPTFITLFIFFVLLSWSMIALTGAGLSPTAQQTALALITVVYLLRALLGVPAAFYDKERSKVFWFWSSLICLLIGSLHAAGLASIWQ